MIKKTYSFTKDGKQIDVFCIENNMGMKMEVCTYGGRIISLFAPDKNGNFSDVIVGYKRPEDFITKPHAYFGACIGRYSDRIENGKIQINGVYYELSKNENGDCVHGGVSGFDQKIMTAEILGDSLSLSYLSPDLEEGFPGNLRFNVLYTLTDNGALVIEYSATSDKDTICNFTNHSYFNIGESDTVLPYTIQVFASRYTPYDKKMICHGEIREVLKTSLDLTKPVTIGNVINSNEKLVKQQNGIDLTYVIDRKTPQELELCATLYDEKSGRMIECYTTLPGIQIYTANSLEEDLPREHFKNHCAICMETQYFCNSPNCPSYPSTLLKKGDTYRSKTVYKFSVKN